MQVERKHHDKVRSSTKSVMALPIQTELTIIWPRMELMHAKPLTRPQYLSLTINKTNRTVYRLVGLTGMYHMMFECALAQASG